VEEALAQLNLDFDEGLQVVLRWTRLEPGRFFLSCRCERRRANRPGGERQASLERGVWILSTRSGIADDTRCDDAGGVDYRGSSGRKALFLTRIQLVKLAL
jgi:hypothetical protein